MHANWLMRTAATVVAFTATLTLSGCMSLFPFDVSKSELVGTWESEKYDVTLTLHEDLTVELTNVPTGYVDVSTIDLLDPDTPNQERISLTGSWSLGFENLSLGGDGGRGDTVGLRLNEIADDYVDVYLSANFWGKFERIYLIQGDPDSGDYLWFSKREAESD